MQTAFAELRSAHGETFRLVLLLLLAAGCCWLLLLAAAAAAAAAACRLSTVDCYSQSAGRPRARLVSIRRIRAPRNYPRSYSRRNGRANDYERTSCRKRDEDEGKRTNERSTLVGCRRRRRRRRSTLHWLGNRERYTGRYSLPDDRRRSVSEAGRGAGSRSPRETSTAPKEHRETVFSRLAAVLRFIVSTCTVICHGREESRGE